MNKPVILAVDDDPQVLAAVLRDLRPKYAEDYQILGAASGEEGLEAVAGILGRGRTIALFLVDQRMPNGLAAVLVFQVTFGHIGRVIGAVDQYMIPGLVLGRLRQGEGVVPFVVPLKGRVHIKDDAPVVEAAVVDQLSDAELCDMMRHGRDCGIGL